MININAKIYGFISITPTTFNISKQWYSISDTKRKQQKGVLESTLSCSYDVSKISDKQEMIQTRVEAEEQEGGDTEEEEETQ